MSRSQQVDSLPQAFNLGANQSPTLSLLSQLRLAFSHLKEDQEIHSGHKSRLRVSFLLFHAGMRVCTLYRLARAFELSGHRGWARFFCHLLRQWGRCDIHYTAHLEPGVCFPHGMGVVIGEGVYISRNCSIFQHCTLGSMEGHEGAPELKEGVNLYPGTVLAGAIEVGEYCRIGPNVYLTENLPSHTRVSPHPPAFRSQLK